MGLVDPLQGSLPKYQQSLSLTPYSGPSVHGLRGLEVNLIVVVDLAQHGFYDAPSRNIFMAQVEVLGRT